MSWGKKSKKKPSVLTNFNFLVNFIRHIGPMVTRVTRRTGSKWAGGKNQRKNLMFWPTSIFLSISIDTLVAWSPQVNRYTGSLSQLPVVEMSWGKNLRKNLIVLTNFHLLVYFIIHTGHMVTTGQQLRILHLLSPINFFHNFSHFCDHHRLMLHWRKLFSKESDLLPQF